MMTLVVNAKVLSHKGVPVFDDMSNEGLKRFIIERYMKSGLIIVVCNFLR